MTSERPSSPVLSVLARLPVTIVLSDIQTGEIVWASTPDPSVMGLRRAEDVLGRNLLDFVRPDQHSAALRDLEAVARGQSPPPAVYHLVRSGGRTLDVQIASTPTSFDGRAMMLSLVTDVTDMQTTLRDLAESQERYRTLVDTSFDGIVVVSTAEGILFANETFLRAMRASSADDVLGKPPYRFIHPDQHAIVRETRRRVLRYGKPVPPLPLTLIRLDGTHVETTAQIMRVHWSGEAVTQTRLRDLGPVEP